jgi:hypothetical protein
MDVCLKEPKSLRRPRSEEVNKQVAEEFDYVLIAYLPFLRGESGV